MRVDSCRAESADPSAPLPPPRRNGILETQPGGRLRLTATPDPFNPLIDLRFGLPGRTTVELEVFDISGKLVATLVAGQEMQGGPQTVTWNGTDRHGRAVPAGVYVCRLKAGDHSAALRVALVR